jgi:hypothetical protein
MTVQPVGSVGCDYARPLDPQLVAKAGYRYVGRYINGSRTHWKVLTPTERDRLHAAGVDIFLIWETSADRPLSGATGGKIDGLKAVADAYRLGCPPEVPIVCAFDIDVWSANIVACEAYGRAFAATLAPYRFGLYGDWDIIERLQGISHLNVLANAWGWSGGRDRVHPATHIRQGAQTTTAFGALDPLRTIRPHQTWGETAPVVPPPVTVPPESVHNTYPEESDMPARLIRVQGDAAVLAVAGTTASSAVSAETIAALQGAGIYETTPPQVVPRSALRALRFDGPLPDYTGVGPEFPGRTTAADFRN